MSCKTLQLNKCEIKGSTFSGRKFTFQNRDITNDKFTVVGYNHYKQVSIFTIQGSIIGNSVYFSYSDLEEYQSGAYILKFWAEFKDLATELIAVENFKISTTPCDGCDSGNTEYTLDFGDEIVDYELEITGSKGAPFTYEDFTQEQINDLKQPAIDASVVALGAAENANNAADLANEQAVLANQSATNANQAASSAINATGQAIEATENANTAINGAIEATENANVATEQTINVISEANEATQNTLTAIQNAEAATGNANEAAQVANNAKGWTPVFQFENDGDTRQVNKLVGYVGGTGIAPTDNIGSYVKENGYTLAKSEASNFKGSAGSLTAASNINLPYQAAKIGIGVMQSSGDVHVGASGITTPANGTQDYAFYLGYNAYRDSDGNWKHSRITTVNAYVFKGGHQQAGFVWQYSPNVGAGNITFIDLMTLRSDGVLIATEFRRKGGLASWFLKADGSVDINSYLTQAILNAQLANYATLSAVQTFAKTITFLESPVVPNGTLPTHAVNVNQLTAIMVEYTNVTSAAVFEVGTKINLDVLVNFNTATINFPTPTVALKGNSVRVRNIATSNNTAITLNGVAKVTMASNVTWEFLCTGTSWVYRKENNLNFTL